MTARPLTARPSISSVRPPRLSTAKRKAFAARPQPLDAGFELLRRVRRQPGAEAENAARDRRIGDEAEIAFDLGLAARAAPGDDDLRLGREKDLGAIELGAQIVEFEREGRLRLRPSPMFAQMQKRGDRREQHEADDQREPDDDVLIFAQVIEHRQRIVRLRQSRRAGEAEDRRKSCLPA